MREGENKRGGGREGKEGGKWGRKEDFSGAVCIVFHKLMPKVFMKSVRPCRSP